MTYSQQSQPWGPVRLGASQWTMANSGCVTTDVAIALTLAGYPVNPLQAVEAFNADGVYTDNSYVVDGKPAPGFIYFGRIHNAFPQFSLDQNGSYHFVQVRWGTNEHWVLTIYADIRGLVYDPWDGTVHSSMPPQYRPTGTVVRASIASAPQAILTSAVTVPVHVAGHVTAPQGVKVRTAPDTQSQSLRVMAQGQGFWYLRAVQGVAVSGGSLWLLLEDGHYAWSGATDYNPTSNA